VSLSGGSSERGKDDRPLVDREGEGLHVVGDCLLEPAVELVADKLADRLERARADGGRAPRLHARRAGDHPLGAGRPSEGLAELRGVLWNEWEWRQRKGLGQLIFTPRRPRRLSSAKRPIARFFVKE